MGRHRLRPGEWRPGAARRPGRGRGGQAPDLPRRPGVVHGRVAGQRAGAGRRCADRRPGRSGARRRAAHARGAVHHHDHLRGRAAGDRTWRLGRDRRGRRGRRRAGRRDLDDLAWLALGLPGERTRRRRGRPAEPAPGAAAQAAAPARPRARPARRGAGGGGTGDDHLHARGRARTWLGIAPDPAAAGPGPGPAGGVRRGRAVGAAAAGAARRCGGPARWSPGCWSCSAPPGSWSARSS